MQPDQVPSVPVADVPDDAALLDVREDDEWAAGHVDGAVHVPLGELEARAAEVPAGAPLHVVCRSGGRSAQAVAHLRSLGTDAVNVEGGMQAWVAAGREAVSSDGSPARIV